MFSGFSHSVTGASHEVIGLVCQDHSAYETNEYYAVAVIADGHGSKKHFRSHLGSQFAVEATLETLRRFYSDPEKIESNLPKNHKMIIHNIEKQIIANWNARIQQHLEANPVTEDERKKFTDSEFKAIPKESYYGTTLVAAVAGRGYSFGIQIGDGSLVALFEDGDAVMPMVYDESAPANLTASMCNTNASSYFNQFYITNKKLLAVYASSDGLYTSFGSEDDFLDYHLILTSQLDHQSFDRSILKNLEKRSHFGTEDDISLSCVFDKELLGQHLEELKAKVADNKAHAAERKKARLAALKNID